VNIIEYIRLTFQTPKHGWLPVKLELGKLVIDDAASNVLNDPIDEFLDALAFCNAPTSAGHRICLWLEPAGFAIDLVESSTPERCILRVFYDDSFVPPMRRTRMKVKFEMEADAIRVSRAISAALGDLLQRTHEPALDAWKPGQIYLQRFEEVRNARRAKALSFT